LHGLNLKSAKGAKWLVILMEHCYFNEIHNIKKEALKHNFYGLKMIFHAIAWNSLKKLNCQINYLINPSIIIKIEFLKSNHSKIHIPCSQTCPLVLE